MRHRNAIETWSASPVSITSSALSYFFHTSISQAYGSNMKDLGDNNFAFWSGDISSVLEGVGFQDGVIEAQDYSDMENAVYFILSDYVVEDISGDGVVEGDDYSIMENNVYFIITSIHP
jgi:hypothetical protein